MKQNLHRDIIVKESRLTVATSSILSISPLVVPLEEYLVQEMVDYQAFDTQLAIRNLDLN